MARKTKEDSEKTRQLLIDKALDVFYEKGVARTTLNDVATAAGMTRGAIYWRFENKAELFAAFVDQAVSPMEQAARTLLEDTSSDPLERLRQLMVSTFVIPAQDLSIRRAYAVMVHRCEYTDEFRAGISALEERERNFVSMLGDLVDQAKEQGLIDTGRPTEVIAFAIFSYIDGVLNRWTYDEQESLNLAKEAEYLVEIFMNGIARNPAT